jgi:aspartyl aminopeptidase
MRANEMFEKLGYKQLRDDEWRKEKLNGRIIYVNNKERVVIIIHPNKTFSKFGDMETLNLTVGELDAMGQQMKELGWL